ALAALETQPDREDVPQKGAETRGKGGAGPPEILGKKNSGRALQHVAEKRRGGEALVPGAQHIGRADIARPDAADVRGPGASGDDQPERNRTEKIAERERACVVRKGCRPVEPHACPVSNRERRGLRDQAYS